MVNIILATRIDEFNKYLISNVSDFNIVTADVRTQIETLNAIEDSGNIDVIIISDLLNGNLTLPDFLEEVLDKKEENTFIYYIAKDPTEEMLRFLAKSNINYLKAGSNIESIISSIRKSTEVSGSEEGIKIIKETEIVEKEVTVEVEKILIPKNSKKIIGVFNPCLYQTGKTMVASNISGFYLLQNIPISLIDTDYIKNDTNFYYETDHQGENVFFKLRKALGQKKEHINISEFSSHKDGVLKIYNQSWSDNTPVKFDDVFNIIKFSDDNIIVIDLNKCYKLDEYNKILSLCDEKILVVDKGLNSIVNTLDTILEIDPANFKNMSLVINKDVELEELKTLSLVNNLEEVIQTVKKDFKFSNIFKISENLQALNNSMSDREPLYSKLEEFDIEIETIAKSLYTDKKYKERNSKSFRKLISNIIKKQG